jgi:hypothetical protein
MSRCPGLHCPGCGDGGGGALIAVLIALAVTGAIIRAIWHTLVEVAEITAFTVLGAAALAAAAGLVYVALKVREATRARHDRPIAFRVVSVAAEASPRALGSSQPRTAAIEPPKNASWPLPGQWEEIPTDTDRSTS